MTDYDVSEESVQGGERLELYKFRVGATRGRAAVSGSATTEVHRDEFTYTSTATLLAAWTFSQGQFLTSTVAMDPTGGVGGSSAVKLHIPAATQSGHQGPTLKKVITGLTPNTLHSLEIQIKFGAGFGTDPYWGFYEILGLITFPGSISRTTLRTLAIAAIGSPVVRTSKVASDIGRSCRYDA